MGRRRKRGAAALVCLLLAAAAGACSPRAGGGKTPLDFTLVNYTGTSLCAVYVSPHDAGGWEENLLGGRALHDGETFEVLFGPEGRGDVWDVRVDIKDGHVAEWRGVDLREVSKITLRLDEGGGGVAAEAE
ncbi:MAG TPA: hypothetical protein VF736_13525 [Pyrinomonadaceae bacterium]